MHEPRPHGLTPGAARARIMGVVNVTPDSFWAGSRRPDADAALAQSLRMVEAGAEILDLGGESTRPGHDRVEAEQQLARVLPVLTGLAQAETSATLSIDTTLRAVAEPCLDAGAHWINDISALQQDPDLGRLAAERGCPLVLMHRTSPDRPLEEDATETAFAAVIAGLRAAVERALAAGCRNEQLILDPGLGFGLSHADNARVIARIQEVQSLGFPLLVGPSRKRFIGHFTDRAVEDRLHGTSATVAALALSGVGVIRVHDVEAAVDVVAMAEAIRMEAAS